MKKTFQNTVFNIVDDNSFNDTAIKIFRYQYENNPVYRKFTDLLKIHPKNITSIEKIPFLPIGFFKGHRVITGDFVPVGYFQSSGTTASTTSKHFYENLSIYKQSFISGFRQFFGEIKDYCILALLPSYMEQQNSSLIFMVKKLVELSGHSKSGFYLYNHDELQTTLSLLESKGKKTLLFGVTFALLDLIEKYKFQLKNTIIIETGGMKGRRKEIVREELHHLLCDGFGIDKIYSEYGMTELFSQAWSKGDGTFETPPWMKVRIRDVNDPLSYVSTGKTGGINIIDLANIDSCCFIATQDLGRITAKNSFEVLGRFDNADIRGCNLLIG